MTCGKLYNTKSDLVYSIKLLPINVNVKIDIISESQAPIPFS